MGRAARPKEGGFSIVELLVSFLLLTIVLAGTMSMQLTTMRTTRNARASSMATALAQSRIEQFRAVDYASLSAVSGETACFDYAGSSAGPPCNTYFYWRTTEIVSSGTDFTITVTVQWNDGRAVREVQMSMDRTP